jgi:hypothetical protein
MHADSSIDEVRNAVKSLSKASDMVFDELLIHVHAGYIYEFNCSPVCYGTLQMMQYVGSDGNGAYFKLTNLCFMISTLVSLFIQTLADINNLFSGLLLRIFKWFPKDPKYVSSTVLG